MANKYQTIMEGLGDLHFSPSAKPATVELLNDIEARLGYALPADYREFLLDYGGCGLFGHPSVIYPVKDSYNREETIFVFRAASSGNTDLAEGYKIALKSDIIEAYHYPGLSLVRDMEGVKEIGWPAELLGIGSDQGGNQICLALFGLRPGAIFFWTNAPGDYEQNVYLIAESFDEFMHLLHR